MHAPAVGRRGGRRRNGRVSVGSAFAAPVDLLDPSTIPRLALIFIVAPLPFWLVIPTRKPAQPSGSANSKPPPFFSCQSPLSRCLALAAGLSSSFLPLCLSASFRFPLRIHAHHHFSHSTPTLASATPHTTATTTTNTHHLTAATPAPTLSLSPHRRLAVALP